jgi:hypothetical protein
VTDETTNLPPEPESLPEPQPDSQPDPLSEPLPESLSAVFPEAPKRKSRKGLALALAVVLVGVGGGGGIGYAVLKHQQDDKKQSASRPWKAPTPKKTGAYGAQSGGSHYGTLGKLLLPMPDGYTAGPDIAEYGNDTELSGKRAVTLMKDSYRDLSAKQRKAARKAVDQLHIEGIGMRTYSSNGGDLVIETQIVQMKNKQAARSMTDFYSAFTKALGIYRNGPKISGHDKARCILPPKTPGSKLDSMTCQATEGDLLITMTATGTSPLDKTSAADLLKQQLDRVQDPGESA